MLSLYGYSRLGWRPPHTRGPFRLHGVEGLRARGPDRDREGADFSSCFFGCGALGISWLRDLLELELECEGRRQHEMNECMDGRRDKNRRDAMILMHASIEPIRGPTGKT